MKQRFVSVLAAAALLLPGPLVAQPADAPGPSEGTAEERPEPRASVTRHQVEIDGVTVPYTATAGWLIMENEEGRPVARFGYTAYTRDDVEEPRRRPVMFAFNGGPGSASIWLHLGILGPRRVEVTDAGFTPPPPTRLVDNAYSPLDVTDVVMVDPVGTGYSRVLGEGKPEDFWGVDQDIRSVAEFIVRWTTENGRWSSPKYVLGESYGGIRGSGLAHALQSRHGMSLNGLILVSPFMHFVTGVDGAGTDLPHALYLPGFAATAWYHDQLEDRPASLEAFLEEVERFALREYLPALMEGYTIAEDEKRAVAETLAAYTGTSAGFWMRADLRVTHGEFLQELDREGRTVAGRIDSRFRGPALDPLNDDQDYDPFFPSVAPAFTAAFQDYYRHELEFEIDDEYVRSAQVFRTWDWSHAPPGERMWPMPAPNVLPDLAHALTTNPGLGLLVQQGYYDLATPYFTTDFYLDHLDVPAEARERIRLELYEAGHMMYLHAESREKFREDLAEFIRETDRVE